MRIAYGPEEFGFVADVRWLDGGWWDGDTQYWPEYWQPEPDPLD